MAVHKINQMTINIPTLKSPPKFIQIRIFGLKKCHLATLILKQILVIVYSRLQNIYTSVYMCVPKCQ
jgi:hypothetical protein